MKTLVFAVLVQLCSVSAFGQKAPQLEMDSTTNKWMYRRVVQVDSVAAGELWERARQWMVRAYVSADDVIQYENKEEGKLMGKGVWVLQMSLNNEKNWHVLIVECRDGRMRYTFTDFVSETWDATLGRQWKALESVKMFKKVNQDYYAKKSAEMGADLEKSVKGGTPEQKKKDDGW